MPYLISILISMLCLLSALQPKLQRTRQWPPKVYDSISNPLTKEKIWLGRRLFYDPILSADGSISCASCHSPYNAFAHTDHALSHGIHDSIGKRNAPGLMNLAWQPVFMWDGAIHHLDMQALFPITHPAEMGETLPHVLTKLQKEKSYPEQFAAAYGSDSITGQRLLKALSAFMLTLESRNATYDKVKNGQSTFTDQEKAGEDVFIQKCAVCHPPPLFTDYSFSNNGLKPDNKINDPGRSRVSKKNEDSLAFKVPGLRNLSYTYPYMHDGRFQTLQEVLKHYGSLHLQAGLYSKKILDIGEISEKQRVDLQAFLLTLNDESFVKNPAHRHYPKKNEP
jgi:cytochrome c peroxidase